MTSEVAGPFDHQRLHLFERVTRALYRASGFERTVRATGECLVPAFADAVVLSVQREAEENWIEVVHSDPAEEAKVAEALRPLLPALRRVAKKDAEQGREFRWIPELTPAAARFLRRDPPVYSLLQHLHVQSLIVVPLRSGGTIFGAMALLRTASERAVPRHGSFGGSGHCPARGSRDRGIRAARPAGERGGAAVFGWKTPCRNGSGYSTVPAGVPRLWMLRIDGSRR